MQTLNCLQQCFPLRFILAAVLFAASLLITEFLWAEPLCRYKDFYSKDFRYCIDSSLATTMLAECMEKELHVQEQLLKKTLDQIMVKLPNHRVKSLKQVHKIWEEYREKKCRFLYHKESGSGGLIDMIQCQIDETIRHRLDLENLPF